ncbi:MAG: VWA domain-containing protein, partial [Clostridiales bacterium]|nr:VWA domain-containing protein [Clostridiales bacterium]
ADASEWQVEYVTVNGQTMAQADAEAMELTEDTLIDVYYSGIESEVLGDVNFYLYDTTANDEVGNPQPEYSINSDSNYAGTVGAQRFAVDAANQCKGAIAGLSEDYSEVVFNMDEPGVFPANRDEADEKYGLNLVDWYRMQLQKKGNTYTLGNIYGAEDGVQAVAGADFEPFAGLWPYFGMRYDVTFVLGEYEGALDFTFTGNTNTWVILDGKTVVMDLGDAHDTVTESVDLWNYIGREEYDKTETHRLTVLYMDRDPEKHACEMSFTLPNAGIVERQVDDFYAEDRCAFYAMAAPFRAGAAEKSVLNYSKTAKLTNWDERTYEIELKASSTATTSSTTTTVPAVDVMMVLDLSGSMNENANGSEAGMTKIGKFSDVKKSLDISKVYYTSLKRSYYEREETTKKTAVSGKNYAPYIVKYIDNGWKKTYDGTNWSNVENNDNIYTWNSRLSALKDAASAFVLGMKEKSPDSKIGVASFYSVGSNSENWYNKGELNYALGTIGETGALLEKINSLYADGATAPQLGLEKAKEELDKAVSQGDGREKYVILFTDGKPGNYSSDNANRDSTEDKASELKNAGYTVITVGLGLKSSEYVYDPEYNWWGQLIKQGVTTENWLKNYIASDKDAGTKWAYTASNADELLNIFREISNTITSGVSLANVTITDVIDSRFEITDDEKARLEKPEIGAIVTRNSDGTTTITWPNQTVDPAEGSDAGWSRKINVVAKEEYAGGNNVTTNVKGDSKITYNGKDYPFKQPTVNVKIQFAISDAASEIFLGESLNGYADAAANLIKKINGLSSDSKMLEDIDQNLLELKYYSDEKCENEVPYETIKNSSPKENTKYYVKATVKPKAEATAASNENCTLKVTGDDGKVISSTVYKNDSNIGVAATAKKDEKGKTLAYAGQYNITVKTGELTITKKISINAIKESEGDPIFTFKITNETTGAVYYKTLRFGTSSDEDDEADSAIDVGFINVKATTTLTGLPQGIYKVEELETMGFKLGSLKAGAETNCDVVEKADNNIKFAIGFVKDSESGNYVSAAEDGHLDKDKAVAKATNKKTRTPGKMTDTDVVKNSFVITEEGTGTVKKDPNVDNGNTSDVRK